MILRRHHQPGVLLRITVYTDASVKIDRQRSSMHHVARAVHMVADAIEDGTLRISRSIPEGVVYEVNHDRA